MASNIDINNPNFTARDIEILQGTTGEKGLEISVCKVEKINDDKTVDVSILSGSNANKLVHSVKIVTPYKTANTGMILMPEVGATGIMVVLSDVYKFIIGFFNISDALSSLYTEMSPGEFIFRTPQGSHIKMSDNNSIDIHTGSSTALLLDNDAILETSESKTSINIAKEEYSGVSNGTVYNIEKIYDKDISSPLTNSEILTEANDLLYPDIPIDERKPIIEIQKGNVFDESERPVKLSLYESFNPEAAYSLKVDGTESTFKLLIGKDGSVQVMANKIKLDCNEIDLKNTPNISYGDMVFLKEDE